MPLDRRAVLAAAAATVGALAGCSGDGPDQTPREVPPPENETIGGNEPVGGDADPPDEARQHYVFTPDIRGWTAERTGDGRLRLYVEMKNVDPDPIEARLEAELRINGTLKRYTASFTMLGNESKNVSVTYPVPYEALREGGHLRLRVPDANETD